MSAIQAFDPRNAMGHYPEPAGNAPGGPPATTVIIEADAPTNVDPIDGSIKIELPDGDCIIDLDPQPDKPESDGDFNENLAEILDSDTLAQIAETLIQQIESDERSMSEWIETRAKGIDMLGLKLEEPRGDAGATSSPTEGMSVVRSSLLKEAVVRFQSNAAAELLPSVGPVKVRNDEPPKPVGQQASNEPVLPTMDLVEQLLQQLGQPLPQKMDELAEALEKGFNYYLTVVDKGYRPDTEKMLFWTGFGGVGIKKVYHDPLKRMPLSRSVDAQDLIVSNAANSLEDSGRVTHRIRMRRAVYIRMIIAGVYKKDPFVPGTGGPFGVALPDAQPNDDRIEQKLQEVTGIAAPERPEDKDYTILECYTELDLKGYEHKDDDGPTGLPLPYKVSINKDTRRIVELRRNWREEDEDFMAKQVFVKYAFIPSTGFYESGLLQLIGNEQRALTAAMRMMLDNGMFANFPAFLLSDFAAKQDTNEIRLAPGSGRKLATQGKPIQAAAMPLPYKDITPGMLAFYQHIEETAQRLGGTAEIPVGEGKQEAPVGTTLALIEQATKIIAAVHVRLHVAQAEEFSLLRERFREDPAAWLRINKKKQLWETEQFLKALDSYDLVPAADPNTPSRMHRLMNAVALMQLVMAAPDLYNRRDVHQYVLRCIGINDVDDLLLPPAPPPDPNAQPQMPPVDPSRMADVQLRAQQAQVDAAQTAQSQQQDSAEKLRADALRAHEIQINAQGDQADRQSKERIANAKLEVEKLRIAHQALQAHAAHQQQAAQAAQSANQPPDEPRHGGPPKGRVI